MKAQLRRLRIWQKLLISSLAYLLPIVILLYFVVSWIQANIRFAAIEIQGIQVLSPLEELGTLLANDERIAHFYLDGDKKLKGELKTSGTYVSRAADTLLEAVKGKEKAFRIDPQSMKDAGLEAVGPSEIKKRWEDLSTGIEKLTTFQSDSRHEALIRDVQALKTRLAETSNLILDPELDSYYMMETAIIGVPQAEALLAEVAFFGQKALLRSSQASDQLLTSKEMAHFSTYASLLEDSNLKRLGQSVATAIREDRNSYGIDPALQGKIPPALEHYKQQLKPLTSTMQKLSEDGAEAAGIEEFVAASAKATEAASELRRTAAAVLGGLIQKRVDTYRMQRLAALGLSLAAVVFAICLVLFISRGITTPLNGVMDVAREISTGRVDKARKLLQATAPKGNLSLFEADFESGRVRDEIWRLWGVFSIMAESLGSLINQVRDSGIQVVSSATEISASARELEATATQQAASVSEVEATSKDISSGSHGLSKTMNEVAEVALTTAALAEEGHQGLKGMETTMRQLMGATASIAAKHEAISEKTNNIGIIVTTITKVADQTNLLSLNAAIEAEKAGEYGLGFSVVAREIRRLADQTAVATTNIDRMVKEMQSAVSSGVMEVDKFVQQVRQGVEDVQRISGQLLAVIHQVQTLIPQVEEVNLAMESQSTGAEEITKAMANLSDGAYQTKQVVAEFNRAVEQLTEAVQGLQNEVSRFTVEG